MVKCVHKVFIFIFWVNISIIVKAQPDTIHIPLADTFNLFDDLFSDTSLLELTLKFDIKKFQKEKNEGKYLPALLMVSQDDIFYSKKVRIKARGKARRQICSNMPPFWLNVQRTKKNQKGYKVNYKIKVVSHCNNNSIYDDYVLREYLLYQIYNIVTPFSFKTRLVKINYIDIGRKNKKYTKWGFLIEPTDDFAHRTNTREVKTNHIGFKHTQPKQTDILSMFDFMIGNTDWSVTGRQNIKVFQPGEIIQQEKLIPVPYDFDYTGFVNTSYAIPTDGTGLDNVRERLYVGPCRSLEDYKAAISLLEAKKEEIFNLISGFSYIREQSRKDLLNYLTGFYNSIKRKNFIEYFIETNCFEPEPPIEQF